MSDDLLTMERAWLGEERRRLDELRRQSAGEFATTRPTPNLDECDRAAAGEIVMWKQWDLSPVDPQSFDPAEPPGRPEAPAPPANTVAPNITAIGGVTVGEMVVVASNGAWSGSPTYARQWRRGATNIGGATAVSYTLVAADVGQMVSAEVTATNSGGAATAGSNEVGPVTG